jgi:hypothetical protein
MLKVVPYACNVLFLCSTTQLSFVSFVPKVTQLPHISNVLQLTLFSLQHVQIKGISIVFIAVIITLAIFVFLAGTLLMEAVLLQNIVM